MTSAKKKFWSDGIRFECQGSGRCCMSRGSYGYVYMTLKDRQRMAKVLGLSTSAFTRKYCEVTDGWHHLKNPSEACIFLTGTRCDVYEGRPAQCRTWPFWPENMNAKVWQKEIAAFCPGVGKGKLHSAEEIERQLKESVGE